METINFTHDSYTDKTVPAHEAPDEEDFLSLFDQYSDLMSPSSDWLYTDVAIIINEVSMERISATYHITGQKCTIVLFDAGTNISVISQKFFNSYHKNQNCWHQTHAL